MKEERLPRELVLDTSVAVKFYLPEEGREEALALLAAVGEGEALSNLSGPSPIPCRDTKPAISQKSRTGIGSCY